MICIAGLYAQVDQTQRVEFDLGDIDDINVVMFENHKKFVAVYNDENGDTKNEHKINYDCYDENLKKVASKSILINEKLRPFASNTQTENALFSIYYDRKSDEIVIYRFDVTKMEILEKRISYKEKLDYANEVKVIGNNIFLSFDRKKDITCLVINFEKASYRIQDIGKLGEDLTYFDLQLATNPDGTEEIHFFCSKKVSRKNLLMCYVVLNAEGNLVNQNLVELPQINEETKRTDVTLAKLKDGGYFALRTYTKGSQAYTNGIYMSKVKTNGSIGFDKTYNYLDIPNFTEYLSERKQEKIEKKKEKAEAKGKEYSLNYRTVMHDIIEKNGNYLLICEFFYPTYRTESRTTCGTNGCQTTYVTVFDGYQYTHALITSVDATGKMLWSNIFELWSAYKPYYVKKFIKVNDQGKNVNLVFASGSWLYSKVYSDQGKLVSDQKGEVIDTDKEDDKVKYTSGDIYHWYEANFLWHGYQKIKNTKDGDGKRKRKVYFVNKLIFKK